MGGLAALFIVSCQSTIIIRDPDAVNIRYDEPSKKALRIAVDNGVFFSLPESLTEDFNTVEASLSCRRVTQPSWIKALSDYLSDFTMNPSLYGKFHVLEFKKGDTPSVQVQEDLDGARTLEIIYSKSETRSIIQTLTDIPCSTSSMEHIGKPLRAVYFQYPSFAEVQRALEQKDMKKKLARFEVNKDFFKFMADRLTIFRFSPELAFEMNAQGKSLLSSFSETVGAQMKQQPLKQLDYWLAEMTEIGFATQNFKIFTLKKDAELTNGMKIENAEKYSRRTDEFGIPTPFVSYSSERGDFRFSSITSFERCLGELRTKYKRFIAGSDSLNMDSRFFLYPGYQCKD